MQNPPRDPVKWGSGSKGDAEGALRIDNNAEDVLHQLADPNGDNAHFENFPPSQINKELIDVLQGARFGPTQQLFDMLRGNPDFQREALQTPVADNKYFTFPQKDK